MMLLNVFLNAAGHHMGAWRLPGVDPKGVTSLEHWINAAKIAERAKLDSLFIADVLSTADRIRHSPGPTVDPMVLLSAMAPLTERIGLVATVSTTFNEPFNLARRFATLDHLSNGRAGWNCITSTEDAEARNFGSDTLLEHERRYTRASEFIDVVVRLWDSWEPDAYAPDEDRGVWVNLAKVHAIEHRGEFFKVRGPLTVPRCPQGRPLIFQAGSSATGMDLAARAADAVFTAQQTFEQAQGFYSELKRQVAAHGRDPDHLKVLPGLSPIIGSTEAEARAAEAELRELVTDAAVIEFLSRILRYPFTEEHLDGPLPDDATSEIEGHAHRSRLLIEQARRHRLTVRELGQRSAFARGHLVVVGTPEQIANEMESWFRGGAADGFNIMPPVLPSGLEAFAEQVVPILQRRGLFRTDYEGTTLRDHYRLPVPEYAPDFERVGSSVAAP